uniref:T-box domain-containing protein n=1 Tax=Parastrongyloides trichosuri TaxID=131310 RepID=A0A0N4ZTZ9_PARTI
MAQNFPSVPQLNYSIDAITQQQLNIHGIYPNSTIKSEYSYTENNQNSTIKSDYSYTENNQDESSSNTNTTLSPDTTASESASSPECKQEISINSNPTLQNYTSNNIPLHIPETAPPVSASDLATLSLNPNISISINNEWLWKKFHVHTTEMIVTKSGRKMFPKAEYIIKGLDPNENYAVFFMIERLDDSRYKYAGGKWQYSGRADSRRETAVQPHHDGVVQSGRDIMRGVLSFDRVKLTNNAGPERKPSHFLLNSMHKYQPKLRIFHCTDNMNTLVQEHVADVMQFIAVTAYQNSEIINLKIQHNPFAKGFREGNGLDRKKSAERKSNNSRSPKPYKVPTNPLSLTNTTPNNNSSQQLMMNFNHSPWPTYSYWNPTATAGFMFNPMFNNPYNIQMPPY